MADPSDVDQVRRNTDIDEDDDTWPYAVISVYVDQLGIAGASAKLWEEKAAKFAGLVDVSEAGASERLGQLHDASLKMQKFWEDKVSVEVVDTTSGRVKLYPIAREAAS